jgi:hypothetical protein
VRIYDSGHDGKRHFVTTELADGETLRNVVEHLRPDRLGYDEVDEVLVEIGDALAYLHEEGVAHGDVRADNVLVTIDQRFKLVNLAASTFVSTAVSASPRADTRDFAAMAYELYGGQAIPWDGKLRRLRSLGKPRWRAIERALSNDPKYRQMTMRDFLEQSGLTLRPSLGRIAAPRIRARRTSRGVWKLPAVAGIAVAALVVYSDGRLGSLVTAVQQRIGGGPPALSADETSAPRAEDLPGAAVEPSPVAGRAVATDPGSSDETRAVATPGGPAVPSKGADTAPVSEVDEPLPTSSGDYGGAARVDEAPIVPSDNPPADPIAAVVVRLSLSSSARVARESLGGLSIDVVRGGDTDGEVEFVWWTSEDTARAGEDFASFGRRVERLPAGESKLTLYIPLTSDAVPEPDERFFIHLAAQGPGVALSGIATAQVTLIDDDR